VTRWLVRLVISIVCHILVAMACDMLVYYIDTMWACVASWWPWPVTCWFIILTPCEHVSYPGGHGMWHAGLLYWHRVSMCHFLVVIPMTCRLVTSAIWRADKKSCYDITYCIQCLDTITMCMNVHIVIVSTHDIHIDTISMCESINVHIVIVSTHDIHRHYLNVYK
jgi:hypothetical protein